jgi:hypothetical protein
MRILQNEDIRTFILSDGSGLGPVLLYPFLLARFSHHVPALNEVTLSNMRSMLIERQRSWSERASR